MNGASEGRVRPGTLGTLGNRLFSFTGILAAGTGLGMVLAVLRLAILTRLLDMPIYGQLTLLVIAAGFVTLICRILIVTGTLLTAFRGGDDEGVEEDDPADDEAAAAHDPRKVIGTGFAAVLSLTAGFALLAVAFYEPIDSALIGSGDRLPIVAAFVLGGFEATFHLVATITRFERRPVAFVLLQLTNSVFGLVFAVVLIQAGYGLNGAIGGLALGSALSLIPAFLTSRHRFALSLSRDHLVSLARRGAPFVFITGGFWLFRHVDIYMVSRYLPEADVALYRAAARIGAMTSGLIGAIILARGPLMRGPMRGALHRQGLLVQADSRIVTYVFLLGVWLMVGLYLTRELLIKVVPPDYASASTLIPLLGLAALSTSAFVVIFRTSKMPRKRPVMIAFLLVMSPAMVGLSAFLIPRYGLEGAAVAGIIPPVFSGVVFLAISQRIAKDPLQLPWLRLFKGASIGMSYAVLAAVVASQAQSDSIRIAIGVLAASAFPLALVAIGSLPRAEAHRLFQMVPLPGRATAGWKLRLSLLKRHDLELLETLLRDRQSPAVLARRRGRSEDEILSELVATLRDLGDIGTPRSSDSQIGRFLVSRKNIGQRDREGHRLALREGIDSLEIDELTDISGQITDMNIRRWRSLVD